MFRALPLPALTLLRPLLLLLVLALTASPVAAASASSKPAFEGHDQLAQFPRPLETYAPPAETGVWAKIQSRAAQEPFNVAATAIFLIAILHTFASGFFRKWAHAIEHHHQEKIERERRTARHKPHEDAEDDVSFGATILHFLGEVEVVFGIWVLALMAAGAHFHSWHDVQNYLGHDVNFTEPLFVVVIMAIAASRPVIQFAEKCVAVVASLGGGTVASWWLAVLTLGPLLGSFITEPAAMTISAMILARKIYPLRPSGKLAYGTLGLLFVNVSVGGTLTHFAAPPILMVAGIWEWTTPYVFSILGWKCALAIVLSNALYFLAFRKELAELDHRAHPQAGESRLLRWADREDPVPRGIVLVHLGFLAWTVFCSHYPAMFLGGFLFFIAFVEATRHHQNLIGLRSPILVGFFLGALVIHGRCQSWWIEPLLTGGMPEWILLLGAAFLTAFNDNAAITFLASQAPGLSEFAKYAVVAGAVAGGGLTVIANAPNPAGQSILGRFFEGGVSAGKLALGAALPTALVVLILLLLKSGFAS
jgi:hypothetical protein